MLPLCYRKGIPLPSPTEILNRNIHKVFLFGFVYL